MFKQIVSKDSFTVVGFEITCTYADTSAIRPLWTTFYQRQGEITNAIHGTYYGVAEDRQEDFTYWIGVAVTEVGDIPDGMTVKVVPAQDYAVFEHQGPASQVGDTYRYIYGTWMGEAGYERHGAIFTEQYDDRFIPEDRPGAERSIMDIYLPVRKK